MIDAHGHVIPRPDGYKAKCGGPAMCRYCQQELDALRTKANAVPDYERIVAPASEHRPSPEWYRAKIAETLDDDFSIGPSMQAPAGKMSNDELCDFGRRFEAHLTFIQSAEGPLQLSRIEFKPDQLRSALASMQAPAAPTVEQSIGLLVTALAESKGWMRSYADAIVRDAIDRRDTGQAPAPGSTQQAPEPAGVYAEPKPDAWRYGACLFSSYDEAAEFAKYDNTGYQIEPLFADATHALRAGRDAEDAARYRWLRDRMTYHISDGKPPVLASVSKRVWYHATDDESYPLDDVIDASRKATGEAS